MITEDYVSLETAKLLKEKGFDVNAIIFWHIVPSETFNFKDLEKIVCGDVNEPEYSENYYPKITLQMAMKWIRDKYKILISPYALSLGWYFEIFDLANTDISGSKPLHKVGIPSKEEVLDSYEKACEAAIKLTLVSLVDKEDKDIF